MATNCANCGKNVSDHRVINERNRCDDGGFFATGGPTSRLGALELRVQHLVRAAEQTLADETRGSTAYITAKASLHAYHRVLQQIQEV